MQHFWHSEWRAETGWVWGLLISHGRFTSGWVVETVGLIIFVCFAFSGQKETERNGATPWRTNFDNKRHKMQLTTGCAVLSVHSVWAEASGVKAGRPCGSTGSENGAGQSDGDHRNWGSERRWGQEKRAAHCLSASEFLIVVFDAIFHSMSTLAQM